MHFSTYFSQKKLSTFSNYKSELKGRQKHMGKIKKKKLQTKNKNKKKTPAKFVTYVQKPPFLRKKNRALYDSK